MAIFLPITKRSASATAIALFFGLALGAWYLQSDLRAHLETERIGRIVATKNFETVSETLASIDSERFNFLINDDGYSLFNAAILNRRNSEIIDLFNKFEFDPSRADNYGQTYLHHAINNNNVEAVTFLLKKRASIDKENSVNQSPSDYCKIALRDQPKFRSCLIFFEIVGNRAN